VGYKWLAVLAHLADVGALTEPIGARQQLMVEALCGLA
jgi:hypothetical protein